MVVAQDLRGFGLAFGLTLVGCGETVGEPYVFPLPPAAGAGGAGGGESTAGAATAGMAASAGRPPLVVGGAGSGGPAMPSDELAAWPSAGCGLESEQALEVFVEYVIPTSGSKGDDATGIAGPWSYERKFYVSLPPAYDPTKAYALAVELPGCGATGRDVYPLRMAREQIIRVGLTPPPNAIEHGTAPNQQCFDDYEGDDSVDFVFFEEVLTQLNARFCYDRSRVLVLGNSSGANMANQLACHYAGNRDGYAVRGVLTANGGLNTDAELGLTCSGAPLAGLWVGEVESAVYPFERLENAVNRAMVVGGCEASELDVATLEDFQHLQAHHGLFERSPARALCDSDGVEPRQLREHHRRWDGRAAEAARAVALTARRRSRRCWPARRRRA